MIAEVAYGMVDTSIAAFEPMIERFEIADFTPNIDSTIRTFIIKTPNKQDHISYFIRNDFRLGICHTCLSTMVIVFNNFRVFKHNMDCCFIIHYSFCHPINDSIFLAVKIWCFENKSRLPF